MRPKYVIILTALAAALSLLGGCNTLVFWLIRPSAPFESYTPPPAPDYAQSRYWAALPDMLDDADALPPDAGLSDSQATAKVDVFYVHPTTYVSSDSWNAASAEYPLEVYGLRPVKQASVFNGSARVYAPRYRQATLYAFIDHENGAQALNVAATDVRAAFEYYLANFNKGRPYILAGHSQGSLMLLRLMQERLDQKRGRRDARFVAAYLPGWAIRSDDFQNLQACEGARETACYVSWNSKLWGTPLKDFPIEATRYSGGVCVNPLSWKRDEQPAPSANHLGSVDKYFVDLHRNYVEAKCEGEMLWVRLPRNEAYESSRDRRNYHIVDYNLFYMNLRENVEQRVQAFLRR
jgi:hypothetical protein